MMQIMVPKSRITAIHVRFVVVAPQTTWAFVQLRTDGGVTGLGECSAAGSDATISDMVEAAARSLRHTLLDREAQSALSDLRRRWTPDRTWSVVLNAVELALDDAVCRLEGIPLHATIAPAVRTRVPLYANINRAARPRTPDAFAALARRACDEGYRGIKLAPFDGPIPVGRAPVHHGLELLRAVRSVVDPGTILMVDVHDRLTFEEVVRILPDLERLDVRWLEDAVPIAEPERLVDLARRTSIPLVGGETAGSVEEVRPALECGALAVLMPDVKVAGLRGAAAMARAAIAAGSAASLHNPTGPVGTLASVHLASALPTFTVLEYAYGEVAWRSRLTRPEESVEDASLGLPAGPGLGVDLVDGPA
jgi:galactonate dehydratase